MMRVLLDFNNMKDRDLVLFCRSVSKSVPTSRIDIKFLSINLDDFDTLLDKFESSITVATNGGRVEIGRRNSLREEVVRDITRIGHYVSGKAECLDDIYACGLKPAYSDRRQAEPLPPTTLRKFAHGPNSGTIQVYIKPIPRSAGKVKYYEVQYAPLDAEDKPGEWESVRSITARWPIGISELKPGTVYSFQVRAMGTHGLTDWSDSARFMCT
jgi:hypothetical protein